MIRKTPLAVTPAKAGVQDFNYYLNLAPKRAYHTPSANWISRRILAHRTKI
jgi:hypothetical protein